MRRHRIAAAALALGLPGSLAAQGTVSAQGLGYPPGQISTMARGAGGALADFDPATPLNPASMAMAPG